MIITQLSNWVRPRKLGRVTASSAGFRLPNADGDVRAPDAAFIRGDRLRQTQCNILFLNWYNTSFINVCYKLLQINF